MYPGPRPVVVADGFGILPSCIVPEIRPWFRIGPSGFSSAGTSDGPEKHSGVTEAHEGDRCTGIDDAKNQSDHGVVMPSIKLSATSIPKKLPTLERSLNN